ncbi:Gfo/Idh/MocA family protein [Kitasatospora viridis]|uniref:Putative dehydrogenase n=1 Tax=Kitasatospora viridis TaxID=281105 RepID=A0A561SDW9_9ACTN|nr:Gfo/Idh/MocA family oxidoreductase [Kitasatospora viridis]TWF73038.1 putative dehydrogenase [Kitasatospora viridis]
MNVRGPEGRSYVLSGLGRRAETTYLPMFATRDGLPAGDGLVAVVDADPERLKAVGDGWSTPLDLYAAQDFDRMLTEARPDEVIIAGPDHTHVDQILAALGRDVSVFVEKPMVVSAADALRVLRGEQRSSGSVRVGHNLRYLNLARQIKECLARGDIGTVRAARFDYHLKEGHGASYFRRWHRLRRLSGGLEVTKACHHLDLLNWWLDEPALRVQAQSSRGFYTSAEPYSVPLDADIDDTVHALIQYAGGALVSYTLTGCAPWEGFELAVHGDGGALRVSYCVAAPGTRTPPSFHRLTITSLHGAVRHVDVPRESGRHGGADARMTAAAFGASGAPGTHRCATGRDGAAAVLLGEAITRSARTGRSADVTLLPVLDGDARGKERSDDDIPV